MEECGINQTLLITVKVSAVWLVRAVSESSLHSEGDRASPAFPLGWRIRITTLYYDNLGQRFHAHNTLTHITTNRDDLVQVTTDTASHSFLVQTVASGSATAWRHSLLQLTSHRPQRSAWDVSSSQILQVDPETFFLQRILGQWWFITRWREVTVEAASVPALSPPENRLLTNWPLAPDYIVSVELYTSAANTAQCSLRQQDSIEKTLQPEAELLCILHFSAPYIQLNALQTVFHTTPLHYMDTAQYGCRIPLPYVPAFHCPNTYINLTPQQPVAEMSVTGTSEMLNNLKFHSDNPDVMLSGPSLSAENPAFCLVSVYLAVIQSTEKATLPANITIYTPLSAQTHIVRVTILNDSQTATGQLEVWHASPIRQLFDFQLIVPFALLAIISVMCIVYNSLLHRLQTVPVVYTLPFSTLPGAF
ncbi:hypothetical protein MHYP_G00030940 [Metynnis hypsauchen]